MASVSRRSSGWFYSNTNYILAALIIEAASGMNYEQALTTMILEPLGLHDTFYANGPHPGPAAADPVLARCLARSSCSRTASRTSRSRVTYRRSRR